MINELSNIKNNQLLEKFSGLVARGKLNLMAVCLIEPHMTSENGDGLIEKVIGKSNVKKVPQ